jgi:succinate dehydrogenase/fumarate reductase flavoprotein subunit
MLEDEWANNVTTAARRIDRRTDMANAKLIVIGGDAAGMSAASQARRRRSELDITVFERSPHTSFSA